MSELINLQEMAANLYQTTLNMNKSVTQMIGLDAMWCRLLPYDNGEDVIVQEYTLHQYECPKNIKVVANNASYNVGNFTIDLFGIKNAETLEISIDIDTWKDVYGSDSIPQKGDFVLIPLMHRPYEVISSTAIHTIGQKITAWKCVLGEWKHAASRKEAEDFTISIDELTNSQDRLFGDQISKEVADTVNDVETAYNTTTYVDPFKDFDMNSIIVEDIFGNDKNIISSAYYNFKNANKQILYKINATYDPSVKENKWLYSCWFKGAETSNGIGIKLKFQTKDNQYWYFEINGNIKLEYGKLVSIHRGMQVILNGEIDNDSCANGLIVKIPTAECLSANKKFPKFWENGIWKLKTKNNYNLLTLSNGGKTIFKVDVTSDHCIGIKYNNIFKQLIVKNMNFDNWNYFVMQISPSSIKIIIMDVIIDALGNYEDNLLINEKVPINIKTFTFDQAHINNVGLNFNMTNIRLFENEYDLGETYTQDMYSQVVRNASKLILVDTPKAPNNMSFKTIVR